jgi:lipopolysaccharide export system protein LptA
MFRSSRKVRTFPTLLALVALFAFAASLYFFHFRLREEDSALYATLLREGVELRSKRELGHQPAHQKRQTVQKDLWAGGKERTHFRLKSNGSELILCQRRDKFEAVENFENFECWLQESIDRSQGVQQVRYITGQAGTYSFPSHQFLATEALLAFYELPGIVLPPQEPQRAPFLWASADRTTCSTLEPLTAYRLEGATDQEIRFQANEMVWHREKKEASFRGNVKLHYRQEACAEGEEGYLGYRDDHSVETLFLQGNVQLQSHRFQGKECLALSDTLTYHPDTGVAVLKANSPQEVRVWQNDLRLSAPEVHVKVDPVTKEESVEGIGNVHFIVDWEKR